MRALWVMRLGQSQREAGPGPPDPGVPELLQWAGSQHFTRDDSFGPQHRSTQDGPPGPPFVGGHAKAPANYKGPARHCRQQTVGTGPQPTWFGSSPHPLFLKQELANCGSCAKSRLPPVFVSPQYVRMIFYIFEWLGKIKRIMFHDTYKLHNI